LPLVGPDARFAYKLIWQQIVNLGSCCLWQAGRMIGTVRLKVSTSPLPACAGGE
jgi:hypothetical protein